MGLFSKKKIESEEYLKLNVKFEELRIRVEGLIDEIKVFKEKYRSRGRKPKVEEEEEEPQGLIPTNSYKSYG